MTNLISGKEENGEKSSETYSFIHGDPKREYVGLGEVVVVVVQDFFGQISAIPILHCWVADGSHMTQVSCVSKTYTYFSVLILTMEADIKTSSNFFIHILRSIPENVIFQLGLKSQSSELFQHRQLLEFFGYWGGLKLGVLPDDFHWNSPSYEMTFSTLKTLDYHTYFVDNSRGFLHLIIVQFLARFHSTLRGTQEFLISVYKDVSCKQSSISSK